MTVAVLRSRLAFVCEARVPITMPHPRVSCGMGVSCEKLLRKLIPLFLPVCPFVPPTSLTTRINAFPSEPSKKAAMRFTHSESTCTSSPPSSSQPGLLDCNRQPPPVPPSASAALHYIVACKDSHEHLNRAAEFQNPLPYHQLCTTTGKNRECICCLPKQHGHRFQLCRRWECVPLQSQGCLPKQHGHRFQLCRRLECVPLQSQGCLRLLVMKVTSVPRKRKWSEVEIAAVEEKMMKFIHSGVTPGKVDCMACITAAPKALGERDWQASKSTVVDCRVRARSLVTKQQWRLRLSAVSL
ncbi:hypothetical protein F2P79_005997 [Pimephales promelas]|nr:hypothetical protein F2P79_005997 [Pimephales promelas]